MKKRTTTGKRLLSFLVAFVMVLGILPAMSLSVMAAVPVPELTDEAVDDGLRLTATKVMIPLEKKGDYNTAAKIIAAFKPITTLHGVKIFPTSISGAFNDWVSGVGLENMWGNAAMYSADAFDVLDSGLPHELVFVGQGGQGQVVKLNIILLPTIELTPLAISRGLRVQGGRLLVPASQSHNYGTAASIEAAILSPLKDARAANSGTVPNDPQIGRAHV